MYLVMLSLFFTSACHAVTVSPAEHHFLQESTYAVQHATEHLPIIEVDNTFRLGKLVALQFLSWVAEHPTGVISLPTGKTPEYFIKFLQHYQAHWHDPAVQQDLRQYGITSANFPDTCQLKFVQMDEFFPIKARQKNSFQQYIKTYYLPLLHLKPENVLLMDAVLRGTTDTDISDYCTAYENKIRSWGGIGFFLGGIGPDGHIAFNMRGSAPDSTTRLTTLNYESAAAAAVDLGGIEYARNKSVITIGLRTITFNPDATIIIMAAGESKAPIVARSIETSGETSEKGLPATVLHHHPGARFYLTTGAASGLQSRALHRLEKALQCRSLHELDEVVYQAALMHKKKIVDLTTNDVMATDRGALLVTHMNQAQSNTESSNDTPLHTPWTSFLSGVVGRLQQKLANGLSLPEHRRILHTEPHHDDIMLSYHPLAIRLLPINENHFVTATSGFNAVTNAYVTRVLRHAQQIMTSGGMAGRNTVAPYAQLLTDFAHNDRTDNNRVANHELLIADIEAQIFLHHVITIFDCRDDAGLNNTLASIDEYLQRAIPGEKDSTHMQLLKGALRESEIDRLWTLHGASLDRITHLRSTFYTGDYFSPQPTIANDVMPLLRLMDTVDPHLVTVAFDPEGTGPDTHYKVLQLVAEALRIRQHHNKHAVVWGYRNVWYRFAISDTNFMAPLTEHDLNTLHHDFMTCFATQKTASFPAPLWDGPFSELSCAIAREQYEMVKTLLGEEFFTHHPHELMRAARGLLFIKQMTVPEFLAQAAELRSRMDFATPSKS